MNALFGAGFVQLYGGDPANGRAALQSYRSRREADPGMFKFIDTALAQPQR